jgi:hypothetical protein
LEVNSKADLTFRVVTMTTTFVKRQYRIDARAMSRDELETDIVVFRDLFRDSDRLHQLVWLSVLRAELYLRELSSVVA